MLETQSNRFAIRHRGPARGAKYEQWREGIWRGFCQLDVSPVVENFIDCRNEFTLLHNVAMATPKGTSARFARSRDLLRDGCDDFVLIAASDGRVRVTQQDKTIDLAAGEMCLTEMNVVGAADLTAAGSFTTTRLPRRSLLQVAPNAEDQLAKQLAQSPGLRAMIDRYFALCTDVAGELDVVGQKAAAQHLTDLVGLLLGMSGERKEERAASFSAARLELIKSDILNMLEKSDLSCGAIASANGMSTRQAQRLFAAEGTSFSEFVLEQRLLLARRLLTEMPARKISDIAYTAGFNDLSYFNRCFRKRFGLTPSELRGENLH